MSLNNAFLCDITLFNDRFFNFLVDLVGVHDLKYTSKKSITVFRGYLYLVCEDIAPALSDDSDLRYYQEYEYNTKCSIVSITYESKLCVRFKYKGSYYTYEI